MMGGYFLGKMYAVLERAEVGLVQSSNSSQALSL